MLHERLLERTRPIQVGVIGAGTFGTQIIAQCGRMMGLRVAAVAERDLKRAANAYALGGKSRGAIRQAHTATDIDGCIDRHEPAITSSIDALVSSGIDVLVEATGIVEAGARHAALAIEHRKHVVMVTVEADVVVGRTLRRRADQAGVMYSLAYGDEPALAAELVDWARTLGFRVVAAGKGTRFIPAFRHATPDDVGRLYGFSGKDYNAQVFCSFLDGTKHSIEMAALANATGLAVDRRGMHFEAIDVRDLPNRLCLRELGGILSREGVVEAVSAMRADETWVERNVRGGVYAVVAGADDFASTSLGAYGDIIGMQIGKQSKHLLIYRPQHFVGHEVPIGIVRMILTGDAIRGSQTHSVEVICTAKRNLSAGQTLDGEGGYLTYGQAENADVARKENLLPMGLSPNTRLLRNVAQDQPLTWNDIEVPDTFAMRLRKEQDSLP